MINERDQFRIPFFDPDPTFDHAALARSLQADELVSPAEHDEEDDLAAAAGLEECTAEDFRIPALKLRQTRTEGAWRVAEGDWFLSEEPEHASSVRSVVVLEVRKERSLILPRWGDEAAERLVARIRDRTGVEVSPLHEGPVCYSRDRVGPVRKDGLLPLATECETCPLARWRTEDGRRIQDCGESYRVLFMDLASELPAVYYARGAAIRPTRELLTRLQVTCSRTDSPACAYQLTLSSERFEGQDGPYWIPRYGELLPLESPHMVAQLARIRRTFASWPAEEASS